MSYPRSLDPDLPPEVETLLHDKCDLCDDGDRSFEVMLDAEGNEIDPLRYGAQDDDEEDLAALSTTLQQEGSEGG
ncbi:hypothetical protein [Phenylobacterium conjunctum]|uniref:Uncharacterized protein n=1 Tax=Phenylobacterium conjunctum TaxID=1298959 RepID=A0ABW3SXN7_9CAUL